MRQSRSEAGDANRSTLEELLRGNIAGLPEIVEPTQSQTNADEADMPAGLEWATTVYLYDLTQEYYQVNFRNNHIRQRGLPPRRPMPTDWSALRRTMKTA